MIITSEICFQDKPIYSLNWWQRRKYMLGEGKKGTLIETL